MRQRRTSSQRKLRQRPRFGLRGGGA